MEKTPSSHEKTVRSVGSASHAVGSRANVASRRGSAEPSALSRGAEDVRGGVSRDGYILYGYAVAASHFTAGSRRECAVSATATLTTARSTRATPRPSRPGWR